MKGLSLPNNISDALPALSELVRRAVDGSVPPLQIDVENQRILIRSTTASAATSLFEAALTTRWTTAGVTTWDSTANFRSAINVTGTINSSGNANYLNVTAGLLNITSTADFRSAINVTGNTESTGTVNIKANLTASALDILSAAPPAPRINTLWKDNIVKGWVRFDINASITDSFNVPAGGITDNGVGDWTINWDTNLANASYSCCITIGFDAGASFLSPVVGGAAQTAGTTRIQSRNTAGGLSDPDFIHAIVIGNQ